MTWRVALGGGDADLDAEAIAVYTVVKSGRITYGDRTRELEDRVAALHGFRSAVFMNSGTSALTIALELAKRARPRARSVIIPATTFIADVATVVQLGLRPVFVDVDPQTFQMPAERTATAARAIGDDLCAIIPVHLLGFYCDAVQELKTSATIIQDLCEAFDVRFNGSQYAASACLANGLVLGCLSTYMCHSVTTAVGGFLMTHDERTESFARSLMQHGRDPRYLNPDMLPNKGRETSVSESRPARDLVDARYRFDHFGYSFRGTEMQAAMGLAQLDRWPEFKAKRIELYQTMRRAMVARGFPEDRLPPELPDGAVPLFFPVRHPDAKELAYHLESQGIETRPMMPLVGQPALQAHGDTASIDEDYPVARHLAETVLLVGNHPGMTIEDAQYVVDSIAGA